MMMILLMMNILLSTIFLFMIHPLSMGMILLIQTITISLITGFLNFNYWFSYILFLIMIGGMLVLFIYMTSVASNEKFKINNKIILLIISFMTIMMIFTFNDNYFIMINNFNKFIYMNNNYLMLSKFYNLPSNSIMFLMIIYLFITLIAVVKITNFNLGPLRQKF
uniref:NADH-ubiquinone oxidoreductase chain 6 n=1 Tax=Ochthebius lividipennis TaxID=1309217 RepID=A0A7H0DKG8_9COLE|nr:NADH dehydrogenase subunit 6 [Ochthebius lividipennis]QNP09828.1 NADH dehydrogenase subunit 6 [Ochthebius lividipennis]